VNSLYLNPFHHTRADDMEHVDVALLGRVARGVTQVLLDLAGEPRPPAASALGSPPR
jgi:hypothetical protein